MNQLAIYLGRIRTFRRTDWIVYAAWVGLMMGLCVATGGFVWVGHRASAPLPPGGLAPAARCRDLHARLAVDTIGHRTIYKEALRGGEE